MARISRLVVPGFPHHFTQRGVRSMSIFPNEDDRKAYVQFIGEETGCLGVEILAWCLFQGRFGSCILDERHLLAAVRYVEMNPVRAGIVNEAWAYAWSSAPFRMGKKEVDPLVKDRTLPGLLKDWSDFFSKPSSALQPDIRKFTRSGRPAGDASFIDSVERITGRDLSMGKAGRPLTRKD
jgi:putative transposase